MDTSRRQRSWAIERGTVICHGRVWNGLSSACNAYGNVPELYAVSYDSGTTYDVAIDATNVQPVRYGHATTSSTDDAAITNDAIADVATHDDAVNAVTNAVNGQYSVALDDVITDGLTNGIAHAAANGAANGTANGTAYGSAYGIANRHAVTHGTANATANGTASRSLPISLASTAEYVRVAPIPI